MPIPPQEDDDEPLVLEEDEEEEEVLELTERIEDPIEVIAEPEMDDLDLGFDPSALTYEPPPEPPPVERHVPLVSKPAASTAASAFDILERNVMMPQPGRSLEEVVREMLRPMLKEWLDENLPAIVETQVSLEVERIARLRR